MTLSDGAYQLDSGVKELQSGTSELSSNSQALVGGVKELSGGADTLVEGVGELKDGAQELHDGMVKFDEEGIQKIADLFDGDLEAVLDALRGIQDADKSYRSFAGISDNMDGTVKFIVKSDSIGD